MIKSGTVGLPIHHTSTEKAHCNILDCISQTHTLLHYSTFDFSSRIWFSFRLKVRPQNTLHGWGYSCQHTYCSLLLAAFPYSGSPQRESLLHKTRSTSSPSLAPTISMNSLTKSIHLLFGLSLFLLPGIAIFIIPSQRNLLLSSSRVHTNVALCPEVYLAALQFLPYLLHTRTLCPFL